MWFKNLHLFRVHDQQLLSIEQMAELMEETRAKPLGDHQARHIGWTCPSGPFRAGSGIHAVQNDSHRLLSALRQERLLPSSVVADELSSYVEEIETRENRKISRKEKAAIKERIIEAMLPRAFVRRQLIDVWWDVERQLIGINTSSRSRAEDVLDLLRHTLGGLKVTPLATRELPTRVMTHWLQHGGDRPAQLTLGDSTVLQSKGDDSVLRGRRVDLDSDDMQQLLDGGRQAMQLGIMIDGQLSCTLRDDLSITALRFADAVIEEADAADDGDDPVARLEADFTIMAACLRTSIDQLIEWMGGEAEKS